MHATCRALLAAATLFSATATAVVTATVVPTGVQQTRVALTNRIVGSLGSLATDNRDGLATSVGILSVVGGIHRTPACSCAIPTYTAADAGTRDT